MTQLNHPTDPSGRTVVSETITFHDKDGSPTEDKSKAVTAEAVRTFVDGTSERTLMRSTRESASGQRGVILVPNART